MERKRLYKRKGQWVTASVVATLGLLVMPFGEVATAQEATESETTSESVNTAEATPTSENVADTTTEPASTPVQPAEAVPAVAETVAQPAETTTPASTTTQPAESTAAVAASVQPTESTATDLTAEPVQPPVERATIASTPAPSVQPNVSLSPVNGIVVENQQSYLYHNGEKKLDYLHTDETNANKRYYFDESGRMIRDSWVYSKGNDAWYRANATGEIVEQTASDVKINGVNQVLYYGADLSKARVTTAKELFGQRFSVSRRLEKDGMKLLELSKNGTVVGYVQSGSTVDVPRGKRVVYIDSGHGGSETGAFKFGVAEKDLNLKITLPLSNQLRDLGYIVYESRVNDKEIPLRQRHIEPNSLMPDIYVSVHHNAMPESYGGSAHGILTLYHDRSIDEPGFMTIAHHPESRMIEGKKLASTVQNALVKATGANNQGIRAQNLHVTRNVDVPAVLVELGFMDNYAEHQKLITPSYQAKLINGLVNGVNAYFGLPATSVSTPALTPVSTPAQPVSAPTTTATPTNGVYRFTAKSPVKSTPTQAAPTRDYYHAGESVRYDGKLESDGYQWLTYINYAGNRSYVAISQLPKPVATPATPVAPATPVVAKPATPVSTPAKPTTPTAPTPTTTPKITQASGTYHFTAKSPVKSTPTQAAPTRDYYYAGESVRYDGKLESDGYQWLTYINYAGNRSYVAISQLPKPVATPATPVAPATPVVAKPATPVSTPAQPTTPTTPVTPTTPKITQVSGTYRFTAQSVVKVTPTQAAPVRDYYYAGETVRYDGKLVSDGYQWLTYINYSGTRSYVAVGKIS
ncbi:MAG: SH3 domain-containing protein [Aerococcaceae bacterium]|nr:SH3 domain-containing protein [Aerococcaceae bacterium]